MPEVNRELLRETMDQILANPERHNQAMWATARECGTAYCFAGWACKLRGYEANFTLHMGEYGHMFPRGLTSQLTTGDGIGDKAIELLGVDAADAVVLFSAGNSVAALKDYVDQLCETGHIKRGYVE